MNRAAMMTLYVCLCAAAQVPFALTRGVVVDPSGAPVEGAQVTLGRSRVSTDAEGRFRLAGSGELRVAKRGFEGYRGDARPGVEMRIELAVETIRERLTVTDRPEPVSTDAAAGVDGITIQSSTLTQLPVEGSSILAAAARLLNAGALGDGGVAVIVDGVPQRRAKIPGALVQEVRVNQNPYSAEFQRPGSGRIEITTKGAVKEYHGEAVYLFRNSALNARNAVAARKPDEQRRDFEASLSGPIKRGMSFFVDVERKDDLRQAVVLGRTPLREVRENFGTPAKSTDVTGRLLKKYESGSGWSLRYDFETDEALGRGIGGVRLPESAYDEAEAGQEWRWQHLGVWSPKLTSELALEIERQETRVESHNSGPKIVVQDAFTGGGAQRSSVQRETSASLVSAVTWFEGPHKIRAGASIPNWQHHNVMDRSNFGGTYSYASLADYAADQPFSFVVQRGNPQLQYRYAEAAAFAQGDFRIKPNLSLGVGVRYDWQRLTGDLNNIAPRVSVAWAPARVSKTVLRAGFGMFNDRSGAGPIADSLRFDGVRVYEALVVPGNGSLRAASNVVRLSGGLRTPYLLNFSVGVERQITARTAAALSYVALRGVALYRSRDANPPLPPDYLRPDPGLATLRLIESAGRMASNAMEIRFRGELGRFSGNLSYILGKASNNTGGIGWMPPNSLDFRREWSRADFDQRHRFRALGTARSSFGIRIGFGIEAASGVPYSLTSGRDDNRDGIARERPEGVARNTLQGPDRFEIDVRLSREFRLSGSTGGDRSFTVMADAFNAFNRANYTEVIGNRSSPLFGRPMSASAPRRVQLGVRLSF